MLRRAVLFLAGGALSALAQPAAGPRHAAAIDAILAADRTSPPPARAILFIGSSIFRQWTTVAEDMAPLPVFNRAFGGSRTGDILDHMDRIVLPYAPRLIVYYCGSNDINAGIAPAKIAGNFREFVERVHRTLPDTRVLYVAINRAPQKRKDWDKVDDANRQIEEYCRRNKRLGFIDVNPALFDSHGEPRMELYKDDQLHFHAPAYREFTRIIRPVVESTWRAITSQR